MGLIKIYGLYDPTTKKLRYVGKTVRPLNKRLNSHLSDSRKNKNTHKQNWIRLVLARGKLPIIKLIRMVKPYRWKYWETKLIAKYKAKGCPLTNGTLGGDGIEGLIHSEKSKALMSKAKLGRKGKLCPNSKGLIAYNETEELFFYSAQEAEDYFKSLGLKASKKNINQCIRGGLIRGKYKRTQVAGYKFKRKIK